MLLRSLPRARGPGVSPATCTRHKSCVRSSSPSSQALIRSFRTSAVRPATVASTWASTVGAQNGQNSTSPNPYTPDKQPRTAHAIPNPTLAGIEKRWEHMPPQEQAVLWMQLRDRMTVDWHEMTFQEKKVGTSQSFLYYDLKITRPRLGANEAARSSITFRLFHPYLHSNRPSSQLILVL